MCSLFRKGVEKVWYVFKNEHAAFTLHSSSGLMTHSVFAGYLESVLGCIASLKKIKYHFGGEIPF